MKSHSALAVILAAAALLPASVMSQTAYSTVVSNDAPVLYWNFDEPSGSALEVMPIVLPSTINDLAPAATATRLSHTVMASGLNLGNAASFLVGDYFMAENLAAYTNMIEGAWAIEFWMRAQGSIEFQRNNYLINLGSGGGNAPAVLYDYVGGAQPRGGLEVFSNGNRTGPGPVVSDFDWHHVVFVFYGNGTLGVADRADIYLDGTNMPNVRSTFSSALNLARIVVGTSAPQFAGLDGFEGELDEVAIYDLTSLTTETAVTTKMSQVAAGHYALAKTTQPYAPGVLADQPLFYWNFDEESGNALQLAPLTVGAVRNDLLPLGEASRIDHTASGTGLALGQAAHIPEGGYFGISQLVVTNAAISAPWLIEFWMQAEGDLVTHPRNDYLINIGNNTPAVLYDYVGASTSGGIELFHNATRTGSGPAIVDPAWHHIILAYYGDGASGVADRCDIYMDGTNAAQNVRSTFSSVLLLTSLTFGSSGAPYAVPDGFQGNLDELAFYDLGSLQTEEAVTQKAADLAARHYAAAQQPALQVSRSGNSLTISWSVSATGFGLESCSSLFTPSWIAVPETVTVVDGKARVTVVAEGPVRFFRLKK
jgi:hypothetical protein